MTPCVLAFSGSIGSGKSSVSARVAECLRWRRASFGEYVRAVATERGCPCSRTSLQAVGQSLIGEGWDRFCAGVLASAGWSPGQPLVVDGVRHSEAVAALARTVHPLALLLVFVDAAAPLRRARAAARDNVPVEDVARAEGHATEADVQHVLRGMAQLQVDGEQPTEAVASEVIGWLVRQGCGRRHEASPATRGAIDD